LLVGLAAVQAAVAARLAAATPAANPVPAPAEPEQRWLTVRQAAVRVGKDDRYVYRKIHAAKDPWPYTKDGKTVLIDAAALDERLERNRSRNGIDFTRRAR
jgi:excisionase family DNA binding protein